MEIGTVWISGLLEMDVDAVLDVLDHCIDPSSDGLAVLCACYFVGEGVAVFGLQDSIERSL